MIIIVQRQVSRGRSGEYSSPSVHHSPWSGMTGYSSTPAPFSANRTA